VAYETGALIPDGSEPRVPANPVRDFVPTARPGSRLPHGWVEKDGMRCSVLDLVATDGLTLIAGLEGDTWRAAAEACTAAPVRAVIAGDDFVDVEAHWARVAEIAAGGALLVRPDQHVACRAREMPRDPAMWLRDAVSLAVALK